MNDSEKLKELILYTKDAERYWFDRVEKNFDKSNSIAKIMAVQDILQFAEISLGIDIKKIWEEALANEDSDNKT